jgi:hypothetical protein
MYYSPYTKEIIITNDPALWMESTDLVPPEYDAVNSSAFFEDGAWVIKQFVPEVIVPDTITMRQCRLQLLADNDLAAVETAITGMNQAAQIEWQYATTVERDNVLFQSIATALGKSEQQQDDFFTNASTL